MFFFNLLVETISFLYDLLMYVLTHCFWGGGDDSGVDNF